MDLRTGTYKPLMKENDVPQYIHRKSNHPPSVLNNIPAGVNRRLSRISSTKEIFENAAPPYQEALHKSGYTHKLEFEQPKNKNNKNKNRKKNITWFNPPYSLSVKINVGKEFLKLVDRSFPPDNPLHKLFSRQTVKLGYRCMPNMKTEVSRHNCKVLKEDQVQAATPRCKCEGGPPDCPVQGDCRKTGVVYQASVEDKQTGKIETYTGLTNRKFITRWKEHETDFEQPENRTSTKLSSHIWDLKDRGADYSVKWKLLERAPPFNPVRRKYLLCLKEKFYIMYIPEGSTLNKRSEIFSICRHRTQSLLEKVKV